MLLVPPRNRPREAYLHQGRRILPRQLGSGLPQRIPQVGRTARGGTQVSCSPADATQSPRLNNLRKSTCFRLSSGTLSTCVSDEGKAGAGNHHDLPYRSAPPSSHYNPQLGRKAERVIIRNINPIKNYETYKKQLLFRGIKWLACLYALVLAFFGLTWKAVELADKHINPKFYGQEKFR